MNLIKLLVFQLTIFLTLRAAQPGDLDPSFNPIGALPGTVISEIGSNSYIASVALNGDKIIGGGGASFVGITNFLISKYNYDGSLDTTFGAPNGYVKTVINDNNSYLNAVALQADGKIVAAGISQNTERIIYRFTLVRYNVDGSLDTTFGAPNGYVTNAINDHDSVLKSIVIQPDGKIVAGGYADPTGLGVYVYTLVRYNSDGSLDTTFGAPNGYVTTSILATSAIISLALQPDGKIIAGGNSVVTEGSNGLFTVARYNIDGSLDTTFGSPNGYVVTAIDDFEAGIASIALQPDGKIVAGGYAREMGEDGKYQFALARYNPDGSLDNSFGAPKGYFTTSFFGFYDLINSIALQTNGKIIAGGIAQVGASAPGAFILARYNSNGALDRTFGFPNGYVVTNFLPSGYSGLNSLVISDQQMIIGSGQANDAIALARYFDTETVTSFTARLIDKYAH